MKLSKGPLWFLIVGSDEMIGEGEGKFWDLFNFFENVAYGHFTLLLFF